MQPALEGPRAASWHGQAQRKSWEKVLTWGTWYVVQKPRGAVLSNYENKVPF